MVQRIVIFVNEYLEGKVKKSAFFLKLPKFFWEKAATCPRLRYNPRPSGVQAANKVGESRRQYLLVGYIVGGYGG